MLWDSVKAPPSWASWLVGASALAAGLASFFCTSTRALCSDFSAFYPEVVTSLITAVSSFAGTSGSCFFSL